MTEESVKDTFLGISIAFIVLLVLIAIFNPELLAVSHETIGKANFPGTIEVIGEPGIDINPIEVGEGNYDYEINFQAQLEYKGDFSKFGEKTGFIDVVPLISFKGEEEKALSEDDFGEYTLNYFRMDEDKAYDKGMRTTAISKKPPMTRLNSNSYYGEMNKGQVFLLEDNSQFLVELNSVESTLFEDIVCYQFPVVGGACPQMCWAFLRLKCFSQSGVETKFERLKGGCDTSDCQRVIECGNGVFDITVTETDCDEDKANLDMSVEGGEETEETFGEDIEISFWHSSDCVDKENSYDDLRVNCESEYLGGPYKFKFVQD